MAIRDMVAHIRGMRGPTRSTRSLSAAAVSKNKLLLEEVVRLLEADGLRCLLHAKVPSNDGGLALVRLLLRQRVISTNEKKQCVLEFPAKS